MVPTWLLPSSLLDREDELDDESINAGVIADSGLQVYHSSHQPQVILIWWRGSGDEDLLQMDKDAEEDIGKFEEQDMQYDLMVSSHFSRASCFAHTLQFVARKFDTVLTWHYAPPPPPPLFLIRFSYKYRGGGYNWIMGLYAPSSRCGACKGNSNGRIVRHRLVRLAMKLIVAQFCGAKDHEIINEGAECVHCTSPCC